MSKVGIKFYKGGSVTLVDSNNLDLKVDDCVVVESTRGIELAYVSLFDCKSQEDDCKILRLATKEDLHKAEHLMNKVPNVTNITNKLIDKYKLEMKVVDVNFTLDGSKVIISYICEDRVDFRDLVKELAYELKLRIELKQIGVRDQAKIIGGIGLCGRECCCKRYLNDFDKVSVKMAKVQGLSLNPTKISGICGRLMCCLAYENDTYVELSEKAPKINSKVKTKDGIGTVVYNNILNQTVTIKYDNNGEIKYSEYSVNDISKLDANQNKIKTEKQVQNDKVVPETNTTPNKNKKNFKKNKNESKK